MVIQSIRSFLGDPVIDKHQGGSENMTPGKVKKVRNDRLMKLYKFICCVGTVMLVWRDNAALLNKINLYDHNTAYMCTMYFTFALLCMLLGVISSSFPDSAPFAVTVSWNGALQALIFMIASSHLNHIEIYANVQQLYTSFIISSLMVTVFWYVFTKWAGFQHCDQEVMIDGQETK